MRRGDTLVVLDLTRLGRDTRELLAIVEDDLHANGRHFRTLDGIVLDTSDDMCGELIFTVFSAIAKFQHQQIVKGTREGLDAARARGRVGGRPRSEAAPDKDQSLVGGLRWKLRLGRALGLHPRSLLVGVGVAWGLSQTFVCDRPQEGHSRSRAGVRHGPNLHGSPSGPPSARLPSSAGPTNRPCPGAAWIPRPFSPEHSGDYQQMAPSTIGWQNVVARLDDRTLGPRRYRRRWL